MTADKTTQPKAAGETRWPDIAIVGCYPPPFGGISVHLKRLADRLDGSGLDYRLYNTASKSEAPPRVQSVAGHKMRWFLGFCLRHRARLVHLHSTKWFGRLLFGLTARLRGGTYLLSIHGRSVTEALQSRSLLRRCLTHWLLHQMDLVIACNPDIERDCLDHVGLPEQKVRMIPAFVPPDPKWVPEVPGDVRRFMDCHEPVLASVGWVGQTYQGADLYGVDMMVDLVERLRDVHPKLGLVLCVNGGAPGAIECTVRECRERLGGRMLLVTPALPDVTRVIHAADLFLRPTNTDGDAISVRESLYLGTPVVASDAVPRPDACLLFRTRDMADFVATVCRALDELPDLRERTRRAGIRDSAPEIMDIYRCLLDGREAD